MCADTLASVVKIFIKFVHLLCVLCTEVMGILVLIVNFILVQFN